MIDPENADLVFYKYPVESLSVGAGIDGIFKAEHEQIAQSTELNVISSSDKALQAQKRLSIAILSLPEHRKKYSDFSSKYSQASKVAETFKMHSSIASNDEDKNLIELGFTVEDINRAIQYIHDSLGLNFKSENDFDEIAKSALKDLDKVVQGMVTKNFLRHMLFEEFFTNDDEMSHLNFQVKDDEVSYTDRENLEPVRLSQFDSFAGLISETFGIDEYRIKHQLSGKREFDFTVLAKEIQESYETALLDN